MIIFSTNSYEWDVTNYGLTFNESSDYFSDKQSKSFSFPINVEIDEDISYKLGLVNIDGVWKYNTKIEGYLIIDNDFYEAYISINQVVGDKLELTFFYGKETLKVFDKELKSLNFQVVIATPSLVAHAESELIKSYPDATHQFVKVLREDLKTKTNYSHFDFYLNNYIQDENTSVWSFPENTNETIDNELVAVNRNIMVPLPYLMETVRVIYAEEGLELRGDWVNDDFNQKILIVPKNYLERFAASQYLDYSFTTYTNQEQINGQTVNVYKQIHTPTNLGTHNIKMKVNMSSLMAQYFSLKVIQNNVVLYEARSNNQQVILDETLDINILDNSVFFDITVELKLVQQNQGIGNFNNFTYEYKEGALNVFPTSFTLADFMPDMKVRKFINKIRTWFNLKIDYTENAVYINYLDDHVSELYFNDKTELEQPKPSRILNRNNLFKLTYPNKKEVLVNKTGQVFTEDGFVSEEIEHIDFDVLPLDVKENYNSTTAVYPEDAEDLMFVLFDGKQFGENIAVNQINNRSLSLQDVFNRNWKNWLKFRSNSEKYKDSFYIHFTEALNIKEGIFKYNQHHLMLSIRKKRVSNEYWKVDVETETL